MESIIVKNCKLCHEYYNAANNTTKDTQKIGFFRLRDEAVNRALKGIIALYDEIQHDEGSTFLDQRKVVFEHCENMKKKCIDCDYSSSHLYDIWEDERKQIGKKYADHYGELQDVLFKNNQLNRDTS